MPYMKAKNNTRGFLSEFKLKQQMCEIGQRIWLRGYCAGNEGNHSIRVSDNRFLCTPTGKSKGDLKPDDICTVDGDGKQISGRLKRTSEFLLHAAIYRNRKDVNAVVHSHPPHATAFAISGMEIPSCIHPEAELFLGPVKTAKYVAPGDQRLGESIEPFVKDSNTIILANHGVVCFAQDLETAYYQLEIIDAYCRILMLAKGIGSIQPLDGAQMSELLEVKKKWGFTDPRSAGSVTCNASDFMSRVGGECGSRGMMMSGDVATSLQSPIDRNAMDQISEEQFEMLVQTLTNEIMAADSQR